jgi:dGTPase
MVKDFVHATLKTDLEEPGISEEVRNAMETLRAFLYERVYESAWTKGEFKKARKILLDLYGHYMDHPEQVLKDLPSEEPDIRIKVCDFISGMTDRFALMTYERLFMPEQWSVY